MPLLNMARRKVMFQQVERGDNVQTARTEAGCCLRRDICARAANCPPVRCVLNTATKSAIWNICGGTNRRSKPEGRTIQ